MGDGEVSSIVRRTLEWLAACYVEVGRVDDARVEAAEVMRINPGYPIQRQKQSSPLKEPMRDRYYADMAKAGLK